MPDDKRTPTTYREAMTELAKVNQRLRMLEAFLDAYDAWDTDGPIDMDAFQNLRAARRLLGD